MRRNMYQSILVAGISVFMFSQQMAAKDSSETLSESNGQHVLFDPSSISAESTNQVLGPTSLQQSRPGGSCLVSEQGCGRAAIFRSSCGKARRFMSKL